MNTFDRALRAAGASSRQLLGRGVTRRAGTGGLPHLSAISTESA